MPNFNQVTLAGNLTRDPELRYTSNKTPVMNCGLAVNRKWKDDQGVKKEDVLFIEFTAWSKLGESISKHMSKGAAILISGFLKQEIRDDDGTRRTKHYVVCTDCQFLDGKKEVK